MLMAVARLLGKETYGQFVIIQSSLGMLGIFAGFGIGAVSTRYSSELRLRSPERLSHILALAECTVLVFGFFVSAGMSLSAGWIAGHMLGAPTLIIPLSISAGAVFFSALDGYQKSVLIGFEALREYAIGSIIGVAIGFPIMLLAAKYFGLQGVSVATTLNAFTQAIISRYQMLYVLRKYNIQRDKSNLLKEWPILWHFAFPALLSGVVVAPAHWAVQAMIANTKNGYAELAVMGVAMQWFTIVMFIPATAGRVVLPILTDHVTQNDGVKSRKILLYAIIANAFIVAPLIILVAFFGDHIMTLYGNDFKKDHISLMIAVMAAGLLAIQSPVGYLLLAKSKMWLAFFMNLGWALIYVGMSYFLRRFGSVGVISAMGLAYLVHTIWVFAYVRTVLFSTEEIVIFKSGSIVHLDFRGDGL